MLNNQQLNEGLRSNDLKEMVYPTFEVDTFRSKMGEDRDVCVISFQVKDREPARDLMEFIEKGYSFVLDADVSSGENEKGEYSVFVEISRSSRIAEQIKELTYGVKKLTGIDDWKFKYHKEDNIHEASEENLKKLIPNSAAAYEILLNGVRTEEVKKFFNKTLMDDLKIDENTITIFKPFDRQIKLKWIKEDESEKILEGITDPVVIDDNSVSEIFWLTKVLGDYEIAKFGENFLFTNNGKSMLLQRIE